MLLDRNKSGHKGKVIREIRADGFNDTLGMCSEIKIIFTDGTSIILGRDWRGQECYISEYVE